MAETKSYLRTRFCLELRQRVVRVSKLFMCQPLCLLSHCHHTLVALGHSSAGPVQHLLLEVGSTHEGLCDDVQLYIVLLVEGWQSLDRVCLCNMNLNSS